MVCFLSLIRYIPFDYIRGRAVANCSDVIAVSPKLTAPQSLFHLGKLLEHLPARNAFQNIHNLRGRIPGRGGQKNVNVIAVGGQRNYRKTISFGNFPDDSIDCVANYHLRQNIVTIFHNPDEVIFYYIPRVCGYGITWHMPQLYHTALTRVGGYPPTTPLICSPPQADGVND